MRRTGAAMMLAALLTALTTFTAGAAAADDPPHAYHRLDRISAALAKDPLFVDPDLSHVLDASERARVRRAIGEAARRLGVPVYVVVVPNPTESESQGLDEAFLYALHERSGRDGLYLMANAYGNLESEGFRVPRRYRYLFLDDEGTPAPGSWRPANRDRPFDDLAKRIIERMNNYVTAPSASPTTPTLYSSPDPFGEEHTLKKAEPEISSRFATGFLAVGPITAVLLYGAGVGVGALRKRRGKSALLRRLGHRASWTSPSVGRLRRQAAREVEALRGSLAATEAEQGRSYAVAAYDAAQILYDDAKEDDDRAIDLVGAIVLARQGRVALSRDVARPPAPCAVNPLHGTSAGHRRLTKISHWSLPKPSPVCAACARADRQGRLTERHLLRVPGPGGRRPHTEIDGVWRETAWGAKGKNFLPRVMRYLGVD
ncbi:MAG TPA: hypothetical protein VIL71_16960 [Spirillospora sp.]